MKLGDIDLSDVHVFEQAVPYDYFAFLRSEHPVSWTARPNGTGFWSVTRYKDITEVEANPEVFSSRTNVTPAEVPEETLAATVDRMIILSDPPRHGALRKLIMSGFTPKAISRIEEHIRQLAVDSIDAVIEDGVCDFHDVGAHMPIEVVADLLGVPAEDRQNLFNWANAMFGAGDTRVSSNAGMERARREMFGYAMTLAHQRRVQPGDDVFSQIAMAEMEGEQLSEFDLGCFFLILATAGNETTRTQILHGTKLLIENPEAMQMLRSDSSLLPNAVEEMLRLTSPALAFARKATQDYQLGGQTIKAGDQVVMWYCSGSRDEEIFANPDEFDIHRKNARDHMAFGSKTGIHRCLGAMLARSELMAFIKEVVTRLPDIRLDGDIERLRSNFTNGINHMPVRFTPGKANRAQKISFYAANADKSYSHA
ncbi:cytochrome P450|uniref:cytochrome P450 n=1 Tax=Pseudomonas sp. SbOxS1 TaxID=2723884 RepID=UPI0015D2B807|nr:cytochrome P450 [Pseudomonas sp. SbOxS1]NYU03320.1 cytochrome P450 [Pseudomonas sp. SbOxS1]